MIHGEKVFMDTVNEEDLEVLRVMRNSGSTWKYLSNTFQINQQNQIKWYIDQSLDLTKQYFLIRQLKTNSAVGCVWFDDWDRINSHCRIGIFIADGYKRRGYALDSLQGFIDYLHNSLNIHRVWLLVHEDNEAARNLYTKLGFKNEGIQKDAIFRNGKYSNYIMMAKIW
jgi:RimJ/RimL family protein N-acetyltransferase